MIDCGVDEASIGAALDRLFSAEFQSLAMTVNPYGGGEASQKVISNWRRSRSRTAQEGILDSEETIVALSSLAVFSFPNWLCIG